jgi:hypothetical protein
LNGPIGCFIRQKKADRAFVNEDERLAMFAPAGIENSQNAGFDRQKYKRRRR